MVFREEGEGVICFVTSGQAGLPSQFGCVCARAIRTPNGTGPAESESDRKTSRPAPSEPRHQVVDLCTSMRARRPTRNLPRKLAKQRRCSNYTIGSHGPKAMRPPPFGRSYVATAAGKCIITARSAARGAVDKKGRKTAAVGRARCTTRAPVASRWKQGTVRRDSAAKRTEPPPCTARKTKRASLQ